MIIQSVHDILPNDGMNFCYSGGAEGADLYWGALAGQDNQKVLHLHHQVNKSNIKDHYIIPADLLEIVDPILEIANKKLKRSFPCRSQDVSNLIRRNVYQVMFTDRVYAVAPLKDGIVQGGTAWAIQVYLNSFLDQFGQLLDINRVPEIYLLEQFSNTWYYWDLSNGWIQCKSPKKPNGKWTGIGSRKINQKNKEEMEKLFLADL